eukprot:2705210-Rhodomonas_salina.2
MTVAYPVPGDPGYLGTWIFVPSTPEYPVVPGMPYIVTPVRGAGDTGRLRPLSSKEFLDRNSATQHWNFVRGNCCVAMICEQATAKMWVREAVWGAPAVFGTWQFSEAPVLVCTPWLIHRHCFGLQHSAELIKFRYVHRRTHTKLS